MVIEINEAITFGDISTSFHAAFPFLCIEFFDGPHEWGKPSPLKQRIAADKKIEEWRPSKLHASMEIHGWHTTGIVEQEFGKIFGLFIQVFRREGQAWVQTTGTDERTLEEQNEAGRNAAQELMDGTDDLFNNENRK